MNEGEQAMIIFNAPLPQPDHARRVVEAALAIKARLKAYHASLPADHPHRLVTFGYGLFTGRAIVGHTGSAQRYAYTAIGNAVTVASHLAKIAEPAQIIVGEAAYEQVKDLVTARAIPPIHVKEEPAPIPAFLILGRA
jgi:class 3 adenylate cyclase